MVIVAMTKIEEQWLVAPPLRKLFTAELTRMVIDAVVKGAGLFLEATAEARTRTQ